jgi:hypothetical protein
MRHLRFALLANACGDSWFVRSDHGALKVANWRCLPSQTVAAGDGPLVAEVAICGSLEAAAIPENSLAFFNHRSDVLISTRARCRQNASIER